MSCYRGRILAHRAEDDSGDDDSGDDDVKKAASATLRYDIRVRVGELLDCYCGNAAALSSALTGVMAARTEGFDHFQQLLAAVAAQAVDEGITVCGPLDWPKLF